MTAVHPKLAARRRRMQHIRVTVAAVAAALFIALFSTLYVQMATGNDPALAATSSPTAQMSTTSTDSTTTSTDSTSSSSDSTTSTGSDDSSHDSSAMTTSAS